MKPQFLPGLHISSLRRTPRSSKQIFIDNINKAKEKSLTQLCDFFAPYIPQSMLEKRESGVMSRRRVFSFENTFWAFFSQVLDADGGCQEVVRKIQALCHKKSWKKPSSSTAAYCQARGKLPLSDLHEIYQHTAGYLDQDARPKALNGRRVIVVDGSGVSMPDTTENQEMWPQPSGQKPGCGFPQAYLCACFNLNTGILTSYEIGNKRSAEIPMLRQQLNQFESDDIFLGDKGFCSYYDQSKMQERQIDSVVRVARRHPVKPKDAIKTLGENDLLIEWKKPAWNKIVSYSKAEWEALPESLRLRQIKVSVEYPGFRTESFYIVTTLLDAQTYRAEDLADLYYQRWRVELFFRDIKTTMGMDVLRCKTPEMVEKEILMHFIAYNCIRRLICESSEQMNAAHERVSFKGGLQALRQWIDGGHFHIESNKKPQRLISEFLEYIADKIVCHRPGRSEPRAVKRRPKPHQLLTKPRREMKVIPHRNRYHANLA
jgi:hypothetical protein